MVINNQIDLIKSNILTVLELLPKLIHSDIPAQRFQSNRGLILGRYGRSFP